MSCRRDGDADGDRVKSKYFGNLLNFLWDRTLVTSILVAGGHGDRDKYNKQG